MELTAESNRDGKGGLPGCQNPLAWLEQPSDQLWEPKHFSLGMEGAADAQFVAGFMSWDAGHICEKIAIIQKKARLPMNEDRELKQNF